MKGSIVPGVSTNGMSNEFPALARIPTPSHGTRTLKGHHPLKRHRTNAPNDPCRPATQREYPYFRPLNLNAGAILARSGGGRTSNDARGGAVAGGRGGETGDSSCRFSPLRDPSGRYLARVEKCAPNAGPFTSRGISHLRSLFFSLPSLVLLASIGEFACPSVPTIIYASSACFQMRNLEERKDERARGDARSEMDSREISRRNDNKLITNLVFRANRDRITNVELRAARHRTENDARRDAEDARGTETASSVT